MIRTFALPPRLGHRCASLGLCHAHTCVRLPKCGELGFTGRAQIRQRLGEDELVPRPLELGLVCTLRAMAAYGIRRELQANNLTDSARMLEAHSEEYSNQQSSAHPHQIPWGTRTDCAEHQ